MSENYIREFPPYGIYLSSISGKFYITHLEQKYTLPGSYATLKSAEVATKKAIKGNFNPTMFIFKGYLFNRETIKLVSVIDYKTDDSIFDKIELYEKDEGSMYGKWHGLRFFYEASPENIRTMETIHMLEEQIDNTRKMISDAKKNLKPSLTLHRFLEITTKKVHGLEPTANREET